MGTVEVYPPSPNWFQASCCAVLHGVLAYAARERVVLLDIATGHVLRQLGGDVSARAAAVALAQHGAHTVAAAAHENGAVRLWDARTGAVLLTGAAATDTPLTACALCTTTRAECAVLVAGDTHGRLSFWYHTDSSSGVATVPQVHQAQQQGGNGGAGGARHTVVLCGAAVAVVRACPCDTRYVAAVAANGVAALLFVRTVGAPAELCRFAAFDGTCTVQDAQWARDPATGALLLAVSARDRIRVFQVDSLLNSQQQQQEQQEQDGSTEAAAATSTVVVTVRELATVRVPHAPQQGQQQQKGARQWAPVAWARCGRGGAAVLALLSCDARGTIAAWVLDAAHARLAPAPAALVRFVAGVHTRPVFNLLAAVLPGTARTVAVSAGMDRTLAVWDCATGRRLWAVATLGGYVYALESSPLEPRRVYFAVGDSTIHAWNLPASCFAVSQNGSGDASASAPATTTTATGGALYEGRTLWKGLQTKVTSLALHPLLPGVLAYGLDDGRSGVYDVAAGTTRPMKGSQKGAVYALAWQCAGDSEDGSSDAQTHTLWSAAVDGTLLAHIGADVPRGNSGNSGTTTAAVPLETLVEHSAWYQGLGEAARAEQRATLLARHSTVAASADGALLCVGNKSGLVCVLARGCVPVRQTRLHTQPVARARWSPVHTHVCATCSDDGTVQVLDADAASASPCLLRGGHRGAVYDVAWAPAAAPNTRVLASAGADGAVLLWDTRAGTCLGAVRRGSSAVLAVHWPAALPACLLCGGVDQAVRICRVDFASDAASQEAAATRETRHVITPPPAVLAACRVVPLKRPPPVVEPPPPPTQASSSSSSSSGSNSEEGDIELFSTTDTRTEAEVLAACSALADASSGNSAPEQETETTGATGGSFVSALTRAKHHVDVLAAIDAAARPSEDARTHVLALEGDLPALAAHCGAPAHRVTALELALLPALGRAVWAAGVALYAEQQAAAGRAHVAATCLAALGRVPAADDVLLRAHAHAAALALQAARAPADTALRGRVLAAWAAHHAHAGRHLRAAECYVAAGFARAAAACLEQTLVVPDALADPALRPRVEALLARLRSAADAPDGAPVAPVDDSSASPAATSTTTTTTD